jgi:hypothetical protein
MIPIRQAVQQSLTAPASSSPSVTQFITSDRLVRRHVVLTDFETALKSHASLEQSVADFASAAATTSTPSQPSPATTTQSL